MGDSMRKTKIGKAYKRRLALTLHDSNTHQLQEAIIREDVGYYFNNSQEIRNHMHDHLDVMLDKIFSGTQLSVIEEIDAD